MIHVSKLDMTQDFKGAFMPDNPKVAFNMIKSALQTLIDEMIEEKKFKFFNLSSIPCPKVVRGQNNLDCCQQFAITDENGVKVMNVKFYDKVFDLMARAGARPVDSRVNMIIGSTHGIDNLQ